jgi:hypothetical protein
MMNKKIFALGLGAGVFLTFLVVLAVYIFYTPPPPYGLPSFAEDTGAETGFRVRFCPSR